MRTLRFLLPAACALLAAAPRAAAGDLLPADRPVDEAVDFYIDAKLKEAGVTPAPPADDANLVRRLTLDLAGRIPTAAEARAYAASADPARRLRLVERLLAAPGFVRHQADELDALLMAGTRGSLRDYLRKAVAENRPWDRVFRELMLPDERDPAKKGAAEFLRQRLRDLDQLTNDVSTTFFGVNISCAKCHDHPQVEDWKQAHFYGLKSFLARTYNSGGFVAERDAGVVKFRTTAGKEHVAQMMFLTGKVVDAPGMKEVPPPKKGKRVPKAKGPRQAQKPPPPPRFSARARLVEIALEPGQRDFFARAAVNRLWYRFFGYGLVMPVDQMHSANPPSHPELLEWLARDLVAHGYDLRRLTRGLVLSRAYARSSRWESGGDFPKPQLFAVAQLRALTPTQLATSLAVATADPASLGPNLKPAEREKRLENLENRARGFARFLDLPTENFQIGVREALLFSNGEAFRREFLADGGDRLVGRLKQIKDPKALIDTAVRNVLSRPPTAEEVRLLGDYLKQRADRHADACKQIVWALLADSEFRFNY